MPAVATDRFVAIMPMELRCRTSRLRRTTLKFVAFVADAGSFAVWMFISPMAQGPSLPVSRPPSLIGMTAPLLSPMRRE